MAAEAHLSGGIVDFHLDEKAAQAALRPLPTSTREMFNEPHSVPALLTTLAGE